MPKTLTQMHRRMDALRALLFWEGGIRNSRVRDLLELQPVQASRLLKHFRDQMGRAIEKDSLGYRLVGRASDYPTIEAYLAVAAGAGEQTWLEDARLLDFLSPDPWELAPLRNACLTQTGVMISYASMTNPKGENRMVYPHTVVRLGNRWHIRAWCETREEFRDFNVSRVSSVQSTDGKAPKTREDDDAWNTIVTLQVAPHRGLSPAQAEVLKREYANGAAARKVECRGSLVPYLIQALRASLDPEVEKPPAFQLEVLNLNDVNPYLFNSKG